MAHDLGVVEAQIAATEAKVQYARTLNNTSRIQLHV